MPVCQREINIRWWLNAASLCGTPTMCHPGEFDRQWGEVHGKQEEQSRPEWCLSL